MGSGRPIWQRQDLFQCFPECCVYDLSRASQPDADGPYDERAWHRADSNEWHYNSARWQCTLVTAGLGHHALGACSKWSRSAGFERLTNHPRMGHNEPDYIMLLRRLGFIRSDVYCDYDDWCRR